MPNQLDSWVQFAQFGLGGLLAGALAYLLFHLLAFSIPAMFASFERSLERIVQEQRRAVRSLRRDHRTILDRLQEFQPK